MENLLEYYRKSDGATKKKIIGCIFGEKLIKWHRAQSERAILHLTDCMTTRQQAKKYPKRTKVAPGQGF